MRFDGTIPFQRPFRRFWRAEEGTATADILIWIPVFVALFALIAETALIFGGQARVLRVIQDVNRAVSIGRIRDLEVAKDAIETQLAVFAPSAVATTTVQSGIIMTSVVISLQDFTTLGLIDAFDGIEMTIQAQHFSES